MAGDCGQPCYMSVDRPKPGLVTLLATKDGAAVFWAVVYGRASETAKVNRLSLSDWSGVLYSG